MGPLTSHGSSGPQPHDAMPISQFGRCRADFFLCPGDLIAARTLLPFDCIVSQWLGTANLLKSSSKEAQRRPIRKLFNTVAVGDFTKSKSRHELMTCKVRPSLRNRPSSADGVWDVNPERGGSIRDDPESS